jgi:NAD(P)-dependent dehydrogenase (short-subunit alcohol dehydrogenase family)
MTGRLKDKVAVITGGASGMGRAAALLFLAEGAKVLIADLNAEKSQEVLDLAADRGHGDAILSQRTDVSDESQVEAMIGRAEESFGRLDILFNNAGIGGAMAPITETTVEEWDRTFDMLLRSVFLGVKHGARAMRRHGEGGSIINTSSTAGLVGGSGPAAYSAAKSGVVSLTRSAAIELAADRIRVNTIAPGGIHTPMMPAANDAEMRRFMKGKQPWPDTGQPDDIAYAALYLGSDEARYCTGATFVIDGGLLAWGPGLFPHAESTGQRGFTMSSTGEPDTSRRAPIRPVVADDAV